MRRKRDLLKVGSVFERQYDGKTYKLKVVAAQDGIAYEVGGRTYQSPTGAAKSIVKHEVNGWTFWKLDKR